MCSDLQGVSKPIFNSQHVNVQKHKRFVMVNCAIIPQNLTEIFYRITKLFTVPHSGDEEYISHRLCYN